MTFVEAVNLLLASEYVWAAKIFGVVFLTLMANLFAMRLLLKLRDYCEGTTRLWDDTLIRATRKPLGMLIWLYGLTFAAELAGALTPTPDLFSWMGLVRRIGTVFLIASVFYRFVNEVENRLFTEGPTGVSTDKMDETTAQAVAQILRISIIVTAGLVTLQILDIPVSGVLAFGGAGTLILGIAAKDMLANFFGAMMIYFDRPFSVGDWIRSPDKEIEGTVMKIGWRATEIRTFDRRPLYVPNSYFTQISVENPSRMTNRRIREVIGVRYQDATKVEAIASSIRQMLNSHPEIDASKTLFVTLNGYGASSLDILVYCFTKTTAWVPFQYIKQEILLKMVEIIHEHDADIAFPTQTLEVPDGVMIMDEANLSKEDDLGLPFK